MLADKTVRYQGRNTNLDGLRENIIHYLQDDGFKVQIPRPSRGGMLIQAQKGGFLRELITAERALNILIQGEPNNFTVRVGIGKWVQNIAVATVETLLISELFLPLDVGEMLWNVEVEKKLLKKIDDLVGMGPTVAAQAVKMEQPVMEVVEKDGTTVVTSESKIVKGRVERVTGAGHFVVYPNENESADVVKTGDQVMVLTDMKLYLDITLEVVREPIVSPYPISEFAIVVKGRNRQLQTVHRILQGGAALHHRRQWGAEIRGSTSARRRAPLPHPRCTEAAEGFHRGGERGRDHDIRDLRRDTGRSSRGLTRRRILNPPERDLEDDLGRRRGPSSSLTLVRLVRGT